jgi:hypothetical protein
LFSKAILWILHKNIEVTSKLAQVAGVEPAHTNNMWIAPHYDQYATAGPTSLFICWLAYVQNNRLPSKLEFWHYRESKSLLVKLSEQFKVPTKFVKARILS